MLFTFAEGAKSLLKYIEALKKRTEGLCELDLFLDSGAFTAWKLGKAIELKDYAHFIKNHGHLFTVHANLDVIGDWDATQRNQHLLEDRGFHPLPVAHVGADPRRIYALCEQYDYLCLGGMVGAPFKKLLCFLAPVFRWLKQNKPEMKIHAFGMAQPRFIMNLPFYSSDNSNWVDGSRYNRVALWNPFRRDFLSFSGQQVRNRSPETLNKFVPFLRHFGISWRELLDADWRTLSLLSARSYREFEVHVNEKRYFRFYLAGAGGPRENLLQPGSFEKLLGLDT